eukprot:3747521-Amphidinium_carterae.1
MVASRTRETLHTPRKDFTATLQRPTQSTATLLSVPLIASEIATNSVHEIIPGRTAQHPPPAGRRHPKSHSL